MVSVYSPSHGLHGANVLFVHVLGEDRADSHVALSPNSCVCIQSRSLKLLHKVSLKNDKTCYFNLRFTVLYFH